MAAELVPSNPGEFLIYQTEDGQSRVQVRFEGETVWLSQKAMAELFQKDVRTISEHIRNIFEEGELQPDSVIRNFRITESGDNSPSSKIFWRCSLMVRTSFWKSSASCISASASCTRRCK